MNDERPTHLDLFSGIGGFALAAQWAGFRTVAFVDKDPYCQKVIAKHWPHAPAYSDICQFGGRPYRGVDLLTGGFPCQPFSIAGERRGKEDDRYLWPEMLRVIQTVQPAWVVGENVDGLDGLGLDDCISDLESIGYEVAPPLEIPACAVRANHERNRVWIVAHSHADQHRGYCPLIPRYEQRPTSEDGENGDRGFNELESISIVPWDASYAELRRAFYGIPCGLDRLKSLGNAIVPQVAYQILHSIYQILRPRGK